jgi:phage shock protein A
VCSSYAIEPHTTTPPHEHKGPQTPHDALQAAALELQRLQGQLQATERALAEARQLVADLEAGLGEAKQAHQQVSAQHQVGSVSRLC